MTETSLTSREEADEALRRCDWMACMHYWAELTEQRSPFAAAWLKAMEAAAEVEAGAGDMQAQATLGAIGALRYIPGDGAALEELHRGIQWYVEASRQEPGAVMLDMVVYWYRIFRSAGLRDSDVEEFLAEEGTRERYRQYRGADIPE